MSWTTRKPKKFSHCLDLLKLIFKVYLPMRAVLDSLTDSVH